MKKVFVIFVVLLLSHIHSIGQNYIVNGDFESGSIPANEMQLNLATGWIYRQCGTPISTPDLFDSRVSAASCKISIPVNKWATSIPVRAGGFRYIGFSNNEYVWGSLNPLPTTCLTYELKFYVKTIDGWSTPTIPCNPTVSVYKQSKVKVQLINSNTCASLVIYTSADINASASWQLQSVIFTLTSAQMAAGYNKIDISLIPPSGYLNPQHLFMDDFSITPQALIPTITGGAASFCSGSPVTFIGSSNLPTTNHYWEVVECDATGLINTLGGYTWSQWYTGNPTPFVPSAHPLPCGKYFRLKLAVQNGCYSWVETTKVFFVNCLPTANAGPDITICNGSCTSIGTYPGMVSHTSFVWTTSSGVVGNTAQLSVCPTTATTYTLTVTNNQTGCSATDVVVVNVDNADPNFSLNANTSNSAYLALTATPNQQTGLPAGLGYIWFVDELDASGTVYISQVNSNHPTLAGGGCWWSGNTAPETFDGYNGLTNPPTITACSPAVGQFKYNTNYRITRGVWSTNCEYRQTAFLVMYTRSVNGGIVFIEDTNAPDMSGYVFSSIANVGKESTISIYPNPSNGVFTVELEKVESGVIEVYDVLGNKVQTISVQENVSNYKLDMSAYSKGIYMLNVVSEGKKYSKKIILE